MSKERTETTEMRMTNSSGYFLKILLTMTEQKVKKVTKLINCFKHVKVYIVLILK